MFEFYFFVSRKKQKLYKFFVFLFSHMMNLSCLLNINDVLAIGPNTRTRFRVNELILILKASVQTHKGLHIQLELYFSFTLSHTRQLQTTKTSAGTKQSQLM